MKSADSVRRNLFFIFSIIILALFGVDRFELNIISLRWISDLVAQLTPYFTLFFLGSLIVWINLQCKSCMAMSLVGFIIFGLNFSLVGEFAEPKSIRVNPQHGISILSANVFGKVKAFNKLVEYGNEKNPEIISISEFPVGLTCTEISSALGSYKYCKILNQNLENGALSKNMAVLAKNKPFSEDVYVKNQFGNRAVVELFYECQGKKIQVVLFHPPAPGTPRHAQFRDTVLAFSVELLGENSSDFIVAGDMNTTPWARVYRKLAGVRAGDPRLQSTWLYKIPLVGLPIDHIFFGSGLVLREYEVGPYVGSDHRPIFAVFEMVQNQNVIESNLN